MSLPMSSSDVEVLLHCHHRPEPHPRSAAPAVAMALDYFLRVGAIEAGEVIGAYRTTPLGEAWVKAICRTPMPRLVYVDTNGDLLGDG